MRTLTQTNDSEANITIYYLVNLSKQATESIMTVFAFDKWGCLWANEKWLNSFFVFAHHLRQHYSTQT